LLYISQKKVCAIYYSVYQAWTTYCRPNISIKRRSPPKPKRRWLVVYDMERSWKILFPRLTYLFYPRNFNFVLKKILNEFSEFYFVLKKNFGTYFPNFSQIWTRKLRKTHFEIFFKGKIRILGVKKICNGWEENFSKILPFILF
jgi:hypothetical protein